LLGNFSIGISDEGGIRREEGSAKEGVIPIKNDASLVRFRLELGVDPHVIISQFGEELVSDLLIILYYVVNFSILLDKREHVVFFLIND
jgi:hypothetical protein